MNGIMGPTRSFPALLLLTLIALISAAGADFLRPALHITPFNNAWLNDPNGLFLDAKGLWHVYYQCLYPFHFSLQPSLDLNKSSS